MLEKYQFGRYRPFYSERKTIELISWVSGKYTDIYRWVYIMLILIIIAYSSFIYWNDFWRKYRGAWKKMENWEGKKGENKSINWVKRLKIASFRVINSGRE